MVEYHLAIGIRSSLVLPGIEITNGDRPSRYPLPADGVHASGESALADLNQRIVSKAVAKVQDSMTPGEKHSFEPGFPKVRRANEALRRRNENRKHAALLPRS